VSNLLRAATANSRPPVQGSHRDRLPPRPHASEATQAAVRGTYLDSVVPRPGHRRTAIQRTADRGPFARLRRQPVSSPTHCGPAAMELQWAGAIHGLWVVGSVLSGGLLALFLVPGVYISRSAAGSGAGPRTRRVVPAGARLPVPLVGALPLRVPCWSSRWSWRAAAARTARPRPFVLRVLRLVRLLQFVRSLRRLTRPAPPTLLVPSTDNLDSLIKIWQACITLAVFALIALCLAAQRGQFARPVLAA